MRIELGLVTRVRELRESGFIPSNEDLESDVNKISELEPEERESALESYKQTLIDYEGKLTGR